MSGTTPYGPNGGTTPVIELVERTEPAAPPASPNNGQRETQGGRLLELATPAELFHTPDGVPYATVPVGEHRENMPVGSGGFRRWLRHAYHQAEEGAPNAEALAQAVAALEARALFDGPEHPVYLRLARTGATVYVDLCDAEWRAVEVTADGWRVVANPPVRFRRAPGMEPLPHPEHGATLEDLARFINIGPEDDPDSETRLRLLAGWLIGAVNPAGPYAALVLTGEQGSAKSTAAKVLRALSDPHSVPLRRLPRDERDLAIAAHNAWVQSFDNVSALGGEMSDCLCSLATGMGFSTRTLYTNDEETLFSAKRPIILNGIESFVTRGDLLDRSLLVHLPSVPEDRRRPESAFWEEFHAARPRLLGALLDAVSAALRAEGAVQPERLPRMADFALWVVRAEHGLGHTSTGPDGKPLSPFLEAYQGNRANANELALESSPVARRLRDVLEKTPGGVLIATAADLLRTLSDGMEESATRQRGWPSAPNKLGGILRRLAPNLRATGIEVIEPASHYPREWTLRLSKQSPGPPGPPETGASEHKSTGNGRAIAGDNRAIGSGPIRAHTGDTGDTGDRLRTLGRDPAGGSQ